jgi:hypothetical protein
MSRTAPLRACPVCGGEATKLLTLSQQPIYQHPVPADAVVPAPHAVDLRWDACVRCAHAWQPEYDSSLLERIYREHYYTPAPDGIAVTFRQAFVGALEDFGLITRRGTVVEIGASGGEVLDELRRRTGAGRAIAFEPDARNAAIAGARGLDVRRQFFGEAAVGPDRGCADLVVARHVVEHVFDLDDYFGALGSIAHPASDLVLETPSLDHHAGTAALNPFHVEHLHVFSLTSLATLAARHGWDLARGTVTADGNLIAWFRRAPGTPRTGRSMPAPPELGSLQSRVDAHHARLRRTLGTGWIVFWGAGSAGVRLAGLIGRAPDAWTDGNPAKIGMRFVGFDRLIESPESALSRAAAEGGAEPVLVIASSFLREILPRVRALGWRSTVLDLSGEPV